MGDSPTHSERKAYYRASLLALRFLEARRPTNRRFGADADARWKAFRGDLTDADRIELMIRDANAELPRAFGAREVFCLDTVAEDDPFGPQWAPLDPVDASALLRAVESEPAPHTIVDAFDAVARAWELQLDRPDVARPDAAAHLLLVGPGAIAAMAERFDEAGASLDWSAQVTCIATPPAHRQLAALAGALLRITKPARIVARTHSAPEPRPRIGITSPDADPADAAFARELPEVSAP